MPTYQDRSDMYGDPDRRQYNWPQRSTDQASAAISSAASQHQPTQPSNFRPFQVQPTVSESPVGNGAVQWPQGGGQQYSTASRSHTYSPGRGTQAAAKAKNQAEGAALAWIGYRAGRNHYNLHHDLEESIIYGAHALRRWWVWIAFCNLTLFFVIGTAWMMYLRHHDIRGESYPENASFKNTLLQFQIVIPVAVLLLAILYCRNIDYSLFKRRFVYKVLSPLVRLLDRIPNGVLYALIPLMAVIPMSVVGLGTTEAGIKADAVATVCEKVHASLDEGSDNLDISPELFEEAGVTANAGRTGYVGADESVAIDEWVLANCEGVHQRD